MSKTLLLLVTVLLSGCASDPYWVRNDAYGSWRPVQVKIEYAPTRAVALSRCGLPPDAPVIGCTIRLRDMPGGPGAVVILAPEAFERLRLGTRTRSRRRMDARCSRDGLLGR